MVSLVRWLLKIVLVKINQAIALEEPMPCPICYREDYEGDEDFVEDEDFA